MALFPSLLLLGVITLDALYSAARGGAPWLFLLLLLATLAGVAAVRLSVAALRLGVAALRLSLALRGAVRRRRTPGTVTLRFWIRHS